MTTHQMACTWLTLVGLAITFAAGRWKEVRIGLAVFVVFVACVAAALATVASLATVLGGLLTE